MLEVAVSDGESEHSKDIREKARVQILRNLKVSPHFENPRIRKSVRSSLRDIRPPVKEEPPEDDEESVYAQSVADTLPLDAPLDSDDVNEMIRKEEESMQKAKDRIAALKRESSQPEPEARGRSLREENDACLQARYREPTRSRRHREEEIQKIKL